MRPVAALIALVALASLAAQAVGLSRAMPQAGLAGVLWSMAGFFTNLTNALVAASFLWIALTGRRGSAVWAGGITLWIVAVGVVFHLLLSRIYNPGGWLMWANYGMHSLVPNLVLLWWLLFAPKADLGWRVIGLWLLWPLVYFLYVLVRGAFTGFYPYYFLDPAQIGPDGVMSSALGLGLSFALGGVLLVACARWLGGR